MVPGQGPWLGDEMRSPLNLKKFLASKTSCRAAKLPIFVILDFTPQDQKLTSAGLLLKTGMLTVPGRNVKKR